MLIFFFACCPSRSRAYDFHAPGGSCRCRLCRCDFHLGKSRSREGRGTSLGTPIRASFSVHIHPMNVRHMSVSVVRLDTPRRGSDATVGIVSKPREEGEWTWGTGEMGGGSLTFWVICKQTRSTYALGCIPIGGSVGKLSDDTDCVQ